MRRAFFYLRIRLALLAIRLRALKKRDFEYDLVFVMPPKSAGGWILEAVCKEIAGYYKSGSLNMVHSGEQLPVARNYFFSHYMYFVEAILKLRIRNPEDASIFATHLEPAKNRIELTQLAAVLNVAKAVFCMNSQLIETLALAGTEPKKLVLQVGAADPEFFKHHDRKSNGKIGFCSAFYLRKNPGLLFDICDKINDKEIVLIGRGWEEFERFDELLNMPNFEYIDTEYKNYPAIYESMSVFVSVSDLEGGPIPLLEAMLSNVVPVVGNTGFAEDVIEHGTNGFIFDLSTSTPEDIVDLIYQAYDIDSDIRKTAIRYNWKDYSENLLQHMFT